MGRSLDILTPGVGNELLTHIGGVSLTVRGQRPDYFNVKGHFGKRPYRNVPLLMVNDLDHTAIQTKILRSKGKQRPCRNVLLHYVTLMYQL